MGGSGRWALARLFAVLLVFVLLFSGVAVHGLPAPATEELETYRVLLPDPATRAAWAAGGLDLAEDYGSFGLARLTPADAASLTQRGFLVFPEELHEIRLLTHRFDTRRGEPDLPDSLRAPAPSPGVPQNLLVQFDAPVRAEWRLALEGAGAHLVDYIPANAFLVRIPAEAVPVVAGAPHVQWTGPYHPAYKIHPSLVDRPEPVPVEIVTFPGEPPDAVLAALPPEAVLYAFEGPRFSLVTARLAWPDIQAVARLPSVYVLGPDAPDRPANSRAQAVHLTGLAPATWGARKVWDAGLNGTGQVVAVADSGLDFDHRFFRESAAEVVKDGGDLYNVTDLDRRKVIRYLVMSAYRGVDPLTDPWAWKDSRYMQVVGNITSGHGTGSSGVLVGSDDGLGSSDNDGIAKGAKLILEDIGTVCQNPAHANWWDDCLSYIPTDYTDLFGPAYDEGARIHSNSWGRSNSNYDVRAKMVDEWMWNQTDSLVVFSQGNGGPCAPGTHNVGAPATAKSAVSSGMSLTYPDEDHVNCSSSPGPTDDLRQKPTVIGIGAGQTSRSSGDPWDGASLDWEGDFGGTSYAAPVHAGLAAILRQYFMEGWYPEGEPTPGDAFVPSGALLKAMLAAGSRRMFGNYSDMENEGVYPNNAQGWGRVVLDDVVYFRGESRRVEVRDANPGIAGTGDLQSLSLNIVNPSEPLRILLAWSDFPGSVAANPALVNNLNLLVVAPNGTTYKGNVFYTFSEALPGESKPDAGLFDIRNPVEGVLINDPEPGLWTVNVFGGNVPVGPQPYALVAAGGFGPYPAVTVEPPTDLMAELGGTNGTDVLLDWTLSADDPFIVDRYAVYAGTSYEPTAAGYAFLAELPAGTASYTHVGAGAGDGTSYFYAVQANTSLGDASARSAQAAKFVRSLSPGLQLASIPVEVSDWAVASVLQTLAGSFDAVWTHAPGLADPWLGVWTAKNSSTLSTLSMGVGFWIQMRAPGLLVVAGRVPAETTVALEAGWNLVGYLSFVERTVADALAGLPAEAVEAYEPTAAPYLLKVLSSGDLLAAGEAYWVRMAAPGPWSLAN